MRYVSVFPLLEVIWDNLDGFCRLIGHASNELTFVTISQIRAGPLWKAEKMNIHRWCREISVRKR